MTSKRATQPLCTKCHHPRSFHADSSGKCRALGCAKCLKFKAPPKPKPAVKAAPKTRAKTKAAS